ncbi:MAG: sortase B protein-sorting domain-containing protein, partial [Eubacteriales bacterium]|nr:sortase B protein-sorting domain-containing protein [Eubacteriales bacterium]
DDNGNDTPADNDNGNDTPSDDNGNNPAVNDNNVNNSDENQKPDTTANTQNHAETVTSPKTGDHTPIGWYVGLMMAAAAVAGILLAKRREFFGR